MISDLTAEEERESLAWPGNARPFGHPRTLAEPLRSTDFPGYIRALGVEPAWTVSRTFQGMPMRHRGVEAGRAAHLTATEYTLLRVLSLNAGRRGPLRHAAPLGVGRARKRRPEPGAHLRPEPPPQARRECRAPDLIEAWRRSFGDIVRTCRAAETVEPRWELEPGGLRLEFVFVGTASKSISGDALRGTGGSVREAGGTESTQPESQPESRPESLAARVLRRLADGPMSKSDLSRSLGQRSVSGQLNKVIRALLADGSIGYTIPEKPRSRLQMYCLTDVGRAGVEGLSGGCAGTGA